MKFLIPFLLLSVTLYAQTDTVKVNTDTVRSDYQLVQYQDAPGHFSLYTVPKRTEYRGKIVWPPDTTKRKRKTQP